MNSRRYQPRSQYSRRLLVLRLGVVAVAMLVGRLAWSDCVAPLVKTASPLHLQLTDARPNADIVVAGHGGLGTTDEAICEWLAVSVCAYDCRPCGGPFISFAKTETVESGVRVEGLSVIESNVVGATAVTMWETPGVKDQAVLKCKGTPLGSQCPPNYVCAKTAKKGCSVRPTRPPDGYEEIPEGEKPIIPDGVELVPLDDPDRVETEPVDAEQEEALREKEAVE